MSRLPVLDGLLGERAKVASGGHPKEGLELRHLTVGLCVSFSGIEVVGEVEAGRTATSGRLTTEDGLDIGNDRGASPKGLKQAHDGCNLRRRK